MNKIFTLFVMGILCLLANTTSAQVTENFENTLADCWLTDNVTPVTFRSDNNKAIGFSNSSNASNLGTPFIRFTSGTVNIQFRYLLSEKAHSWKRKKIQIGYQDVNGNFYPFHNPIEVVSQTFINFSLNNSNTFSIPTGSYRIVARSSGDASSEYIVIDDLQVNGGTYHYNSICNPKPITTNDTYTMVGYNVYTPTKSVLANDVDSDNETLTATLEQQSVDGIVTMNTDGTFTFKPNVGFTGSSTTFTYRATDNGYNAAYQIATVTIQLVEGTILPIRFISFSGSGNGNKATLNWNVAENETGSHFEIERSTSGSAFKSIATVLCSTIGGAAKYSHADAGFNTGGTYYRIKVINNDGSTSYSQTIFIKGTHQSNNQLKLLQNPTTSSLAFSYQAAADGVAQVKIYNVMGGVMHTQNLTVNKGNNTVNIPLDGQYIKGHYILQVATAGGKSTTQFVKL